MFQRTKATLLKYLTYQSRKRNLEYINVKNWKAKDQHRIFYMLILSFLFSVVFVFLITRIFALLSVKANFLITLVGLIVLFAICATIGLLLCFKIAKRSAMTDDRNITFSESEVYGSSLPITREDIEGEEGFGFVRSVQEADGDIIAQITPNKFDSRGYIIPNKNVTVIDLDIRRAALPTMHMEVEGPSGSGKSRCIIVPQLMQCIDRGISVVVNDVKGEILRDTLLYAVTSGYEARVLNLKKPTCTNHWNPLDMVVNLENEDPEMFESNACSTILSIANAFISKDIGADFRTSAVSMLCCFIAYVCFSDGPNLFSEVIRLSSLSFDELSLAYFNEDNFENIKYLDSVRLKWSAVVNDASKGKDVARKIVFASLSVYDMSEIEYLMDTTINKSLNIDIASIVKRPTVLYCINDDNDTKYAQITSVFLNECFKTIKKTVEKRGTKKCVPVRFIIDEIANIGAIPEFSKFGAMMRSYNMYLTIAYQQYDQFEKVYLDASSVSANMPIKYFFSTNDTNAAKRFSAATGMATVEPDTIGEDGMVKSSGKGKRELFDYGELQRMSNRKVAVYVNGKTGIFNKFDKGNLPHFVPVHVEGTSTKEIQSYLNTPEGEGKTFEQCFGEKVEKHLYQCVAKEPQLIILEDFDDFSYFLTPRKKKNGEITSVITDLESVFCNTRREILQSKLYWSRIGMYANKDTAYEPEFECSEFSEFATALRYAVADDAKDIFNALTRRKRFKVHSYSEKYLEAAEDKITEIAQIASPDNDRVVYTTQELQDSLGAYLKEQCLNDSDLRFVSSDFLTDQQIAVKKAQIDKYGMASKEEILTAQTRSCGTQNTSDPAGGAGDDTRNAAESGTSPFQSNSTENLHFGVFVTPPDNGTETFDSGEDNNSDEDYDEEFDEEDSADLLDSFM